MTHVYMVDVMAIIRKIDLTDKKSFGELCQSFLSYVLSLSKNASEIHFVFDCYKEGTVKDSERCRRYQSRCYKEGTVKDSERCRRYQSRCYKEGTVKDSERCRRYQSRCYKEGTVKDSERCRRYQSRCYKEGTVKDSERCRRYQSRCYKEGTVKDSERCRRYQSRCYKEGTVKDSERCRRYQSRAIDISLNTNETPLPVDMPSFWVSNKNKEKLRTLIRAKITKFSGNCSICRLILSAIVTAENSIPCYKLNPPEVITELSVDFEEADIRLLPHAKYAVEKDSGKVVVLSNDTDVIVGFLYHYQDLSRIGLK